MPTNFWHIFFFFYKCSFKCYFILIIIVSQSAKQSRLINFFEKESSICKDFYNKMMFVRQCSHQLMELRFIYRPIKLSFGSLKCVCVCVFSNKNISPNNWSNPYKNKQASNVSVTRKLRSLLEVPLWSSTLIYNKKALLFSPYFYGIWKQFYFEFFSFNIYILHTLNNNFMHPIYVIPLS